MPPSLAEKLVKAVGAVGELQKLGDAGDFKYLRLFDVTTALRNELFTRGIVIIPTSVEVIREKPYETAGGDMTDEVRVNVQYALTDGTETIRGAGAGIGQDYKGKALYMALSGSLKYFLMAIGLIAGREDDPENVNDGPIPPGLAEKLDEMQAKFGDDVREYPISQRDVRAFNSACAASGKTPKEVKKVLGTFGATAASGVKRKDAAALVAWAVQKPEEPSEPS
jgi:hypothetical protein